MTLGTAFYMLAAVLLATGEWASTPAIPYETRAECEHAKAAAEMAMDSDDAVHSYNVTCQEMIDSNPPKPVHVPGKNEAREGWGGLIHA